MQQDLPSQKNDTASVGINYEILEQFKSLFYLAKGKRDTQIKLYDDNKSFFRQDIIDINEKIHEKFLLHSVTNKITTISVQLSKNKVKNFGNWQEFLEEKWETSEETDSIIINWDFEVVLPNRSHSFPQTHSLRIRIGNQIKPNELFHLMLVGSDEFELEESRSQMVCKVDFVNSILASELLDKVNEWYNGLSSKESDNSVNIFFHKHARSIILLSEILIIISGLFLFLPIAELLLNQESEISSNVNYLRYSFYLTSGIFISYTIFSRIGNYFSRKIIMSIENLSGTSIFEITKGDINLQKKILLKNKKIHREIYLKLTISLISSAILYLVGEGIKLFIEKF